MLYNAFDTKFSKVTKQLIFWLSLAAMVGLFLFLLNSETRLPQQQITVEIDIKDKINICTPQEENKDESYFRKLYDK